MLWAEPGTNERDLQHCLDHLVTSDGQVSLPPVAITSVGDGWGCMVPTCGVHVLRCHWPCFSAASCGSFICFSGESLSKGFWDWGPFA